VVALLVAGWIVLIGQPTAIATKLRLISVQLSTPFVKLGDYIPVIKSHRDLDNQNLELRAANDLLRQQLRAFDATVAENLRLNKTLAFKERLPYRTLGARVIGRDASNWYKSLQIDRGTADGLRPDLAVLNADGLIGKITSVTRTEARVLLLTDPNCKASALLQTSREPGIVTGTDKAGLQMIYVSRTAVIHPNEPVISSGLGGVFPKGIFIGTVVKGRLDPQTGLYQTLELKPAVDYRRLEEVVVILE
jgi:rod shape-determining protein MreC